MTEITIPKSEYDNLLSIKAKSETLEEKVKAFAISAICLKLS